KSLDFREDIDAQLIPVRLPKTVQEQCKAITKAFWLQWTAIDWMDHPLYKDFWRFADIPQVPMIHPVGGCKRIPYVLYHLARRLQLEFPKMYYHIIRCCKTENISLRNRLYNYLDLSQNGVGSGLWEAGPFKAAIELSEVKSLMGNSDSFYRRTQLAIQHYYPSKKVTDNELERFIDKIDTKAEVKEIFLLESQSQKHFQRLLEEIEKGEIYGSEVSNYKNITGFHMESDWTQRKVVLKKGVLLIPVKRPWGLLHAKEQRKALIEVLEAPKKEYCVAQSMDFLTLNIQESYYEGLDAVIITNMVNPLCIEELLLRLLDCFEEELDINNPSYQTLVFDILKRLAFENVITIL
ncbi:MAG: hypothetical protein F6K59_36325, partial [Moorea sp. SIO3F7]|nr:hypothetical protein [Moorena sp. SIO3F7]